MDTLEMRNPYEVLGLKEETCTEAALKRAYKNLALKFHPDRNKDNPDAVRRMAELNVAFAKLIGKDSDSTSKLLNSLQQETIDEYYKVFVQNNNAYAAINTAIPPFEVVVEVTGEDLEKGSRRRFEINQAVCVPKRGDVTLAMIVDVTVKPMADLRQPLPAYLHAGSVELFAAARFVGTFKSTQGFVLENDCTHLKHPLDVGRIRFGEKVEIPLPCGASIKFTWMPVHLLGFAMKFEQRGLPIRNEKGKVTKTDLIVQFVPKNSTAHTNSPQKSQSNGNHHHNRNEEDEENVEDDSGKNRRTPAPLHLQNKKAKISKQQ